MREVRTVAVLGAGTMGHGIAQVGAAAGFKVRLYDVDPKVCARALEQIRSNLEKGMAKGKVSQEERDRVWANLRVEDAFDRAVSGADLVIEAVPEKVELKQEVFRQAEGLVWEDTLLASNTSSIPIRRLAEGLCNPARVVGMHFFNPVFVMPLLEVVVAPTTADWVKEAAVWVGRRMGKEPIVVKDSPGFATSRLGVVLGLEAMRMVEEGVASVEDIDKAMELGYRHPMGPLKLSDLVGLDVRLAIAEVLYRELGGEQYRPPEILRRKVEAGELGKQTGKGFYCWRE